MKKQGFKLRLLPVMIYTGLIFLIVRACSFTADAGNLPNLPFDGSAKSWDVFCYAKSSAIVFVTVWAVLTFAFLLITGQIKIKKTKLYIPMAVYTLCVLLSYVFSDYKKMALSGCANRFEGTGIILCYMFMLFYTINVVDDIKDALYISATLFAGVFIACTIGISQLLGHDFLLSGFGRMMISSGQNITASFQPGQVYQTVSNMNYVGMYMTLVIPAVLFAFGYCILMCSSKLLNSTVGKSIKGSKYHRADKKKYAIGAVILGVLLIMIVLNLYGAKSLGGLIGVLASVAVILVLMFVKPKYVIYPISAFVILMIIVLAVIFAKGVDNHTVIDYFETGADGLNTSIDGNPLSIRFDRQSNTFEIDDSDGKSLDLTDEDGPEGCYKIYDERFYNKISIVPAAIDGEIYLGLDVKGQKFLFRLASDGTKYINPYDREVDLQKTESVGFEGRLSAGSARGFIWSRTIPLLAKHIFIGSGADTFMTQFPQDDYAGKYSSGLSVDTVVDIPHNIYLQMFVCTGGISMLAFVSMIVIYIVTAVGKSKNSPETVVIVAGIAGFAISGLFNDSFVFTMPIFYGLLGIGTALSKQLR